ncbi:MAG: serine hydrolase domain-containing protein [Bacteroidota bacterium]
MKTFFFLFLALLSVRAGLAQPTAQDILLELTPQLNTDTYPKIDGILVKVGDEMILEAYLNNFGKDSLHDTRSAFKSITSLLTGIAIDQELLSLTDSLGWFFPELKGKPQARIRVMDLLAMKSGLNCEEFYGIGPDCETEMWDTEDWIAYCLAVEVKDAPGMNWAYTSIEPMLLGEVIARASGKSIMEFARQYLFEPLDITQYRWTLSPKERGMTAGSFYMRPLDMMKIIQLVKQEGNWQGKQIVSKTWLKKSTTCNTDIDFSFVRYSRMKNAQYSSANYGYYWYREVLRYEGIETEVLFASGNGGQYMMHIPDYDALVVFTGSNYGNWRNKLPFEILLKYVIPFVDASK